jgi:nitrous oxide reductase accessory protein NosL
MIALLALLACSSTAVPDAAPPVPEALARQECDVCGMTVAGQPPPRGQVQHRDGTHLHFCSLGDLRAHLEAPSPHGAVVATWVELLPAGDPLALPLDALPVGRAEEASFVVGFARPGTMGRPALAYARSAEAEVAAAALGGRVVGWAALRAAPSFEDPR